MGLSRNDIREIVKEENADLLREYLALKPLMDINDLAKTLKRSKRSVEDIIAAGELQPLWIGNTRRWHPDSVEAFLRSRNRAKKGVRHE